MEDRKELGGVRVSREPRQSVTEKWCYWRCGLQDGTRVTVTIGAKTPNKTLLAVQHEKLQTGDEIEHWRAFWNDLLKAF
jgi:hypothetical protein